jgi:CubicO group peptidase (beta-lactamase class C family)
VILAVGIAMAPIAVRSRDVAVVRLDGTAISSQQIDATVIRSMHEARIPGVGIAILNDSKIAYLKSYGLRDTARRLPLTVNTVMTAASLTKAAFAVMVMQLQERAALDLDRPVYRYIPKPLPEYESYRDLAVDLRYEQITTRMLLDHTSGLPNWRWLADEKKKLRIYFQTGSRFA